MLCGLLVVIMVCMLAGKVIVPGVCSRIRCTVPVTGKITGFEVHRVTGSKGSHNVSYPVYAYTYDGIYYEDTCKSSMKLEPDPPPAGFEVTVYINPENPAEYFNRGSRDKALVAGTCLLIIFGAAAVSQIWIPNHKYGQ